VHLHGSPNGVDNAEWIKCIIKRGGCFNPSVVCLPRYFSWSLNPHPVQKVVECDKAVSFKMATLSIQIEVLCLSVNPDAGFVEFIYFSCFM